MLKIVRVKNKLARHLHDVLKIGAGTERLLFLIIMFLVLVHVLACAWIFIGRYDSDSKTNWIYIFGMTDYEFSQLYVASFYFTITTLVTVGYGDLTATNEKERIVCCALMIIGVISFSYMTGAVSSII